MRKFTLFLVLIVVALSSASLASADTPLAKLGRGITNAFFSPMEYGTNIQKVAAKKGYASGFVEGILKGTCYTIGRILSGVYDVVTFPIPCPEDYKPIMKPDYVFEPASKV